MKNRKTKNALVLSAIALCLCFMMFVGTTYAWFTDSVASEGNVIKTGTLNIDLQVLDGTEYKSIKTTADPVFNYDKWEPGYTSWANVKVVTTGTLALKYTMKIVASGNATELADVIDVYYAPAQVDKPATRDLSGLTKIGTLAEALAGTIVINDTLIPGTNEEDFATLALKMQETAGNEYQDKDIGGTFSLQIIATQFTYEEDSFGDDYDEFADFPGNVSTTVAGGAASFTSSAAPVAGQETTVAITSLDNVADDDKVTLTVVTQDLASASANTNFEVAAGSTAVAGIDLTLVDANNQIVTFDGGTATVTTYILPGLDPANITVKYNGTGAAPTLVSYDPATGELVFTTTHFSEYFVEYSGQWAYSALTGKAAVGDDALFALMRTYSQSKVTNLDKVDVEAVIEWMEDEWFGCESEEQAIWQFMLNGCNGMRPTAYDVDWQTEFVAPGTTEAEILEMMQQYYDAYEAFVEDVKFYPVVEGGFYAWAPYPMGLSFGDF